MTATSPTSSRLEEAGASFFEALPAHFERARLRSDELTRLQTERLRGLLRAATERSPFHRERLRGIDPSSFTLADLATLPPMTKLEMMASYDEVVTDRRLTLDAVDRHLHGAGTAPSLLLDEYVVIGSGGSSGVRGVYAADLPSAAEQMSAVVRGGLADVAGAIGWPLPAPVPLTLVAAPTCAHATRCLASIFMQGRVASVTFAPVTMPFDEVLDIVQRSQPALLIGYPSVIARLADARRDGRLEIDPMSISVTSEDLTAGMRDRITAGFGRPPVNSYGTSEGLMGTAIPGSDVFDFASDVAYIEFVDEHDERVDAGQVAHHVLVTNLVNHVQPLIRFRIDDAMTEAPPSGQHGHQRATLDGRCDEEFEIGGTTIHPLVIRAALVKFADVADYRVRIGDGSSIAIDIVPIAHDLDVGAIERSVSAAIVGAGARPPNVELSVVDVLPLDERTGKARRFASV